MEVLHFSFLGAWRWL